MTAAELLRRLEELPPEAKVTVYEDGAGGYEEVVRVRHVPGEEEIQILDWGKE